MASNDYQFTTEWCFQADQSEVAAVIMDIEGLSRWWGSVHEQATILEIGDQETRMGTRALVISKARLPYRFRWEFIVVESDPPELFRIQSQGDFVGRGEIRLSQRGNVTQVHIEWTVRTEQPLLRIFARVLRPIFAWNHQWSMAQGQQGLCAELKRRRRVQSKQTAELASL